MPRRNQMKHLTISLNSASYKKIRQLMETYFSDKVIFVYEEDEEDLENSLYEKIVQDAKDNFLPVDVRVKQILNLYYSGALIQENTLSNSTSDETVNNTSSDIEALDTSNEYISQLEERIKQLEMSITTQASIQATMQNNLANISIVSSETKSITSNTTKITQDSSSMPNITHTSNISSTSTTSEISTSSPETNLISAEVINAEIINAEVIESKIVNTDVLGAEVIEAEVVDSSIVATEVIDTKVVNTQAIEAEVEDIKILEEDIIKEDVIKQEIKQEEVIQEDDINNKVSPNLTTVDGFLQVASNVLFDDNIEIVSDFNF